MQVPCSGDPARIAAMGRSRSVRPIPEDRRRGAAAAVFGTLLLAAAAPAAAWDALGHRVVAAIAWDELTPAARAEATRLLLAAPPDSDLPALMPATGSEAERRRELFLAASTWPDVVRDRDRPARRDAYHHSNWHYINYFWDQSGPGGAPRGRTDLAPQTTNAVERLEALTAVLGDPAADPAERGIALAWVLHLVGDLHQPLHTSARVTEREPEGDRGGNLVKLDPEGDDNLHSYWDGILRRTQPWWHWWPPSEDRIARRLAAAHPGPPPGGDFEAWAREGLATAQRVAYPPTLRRGQPPPRAYREAVHEAASEALARAGHRLAALLETALGG